MKHIISIRRFQPCLHYSDHLDVVHLNAGRVIGANKAANRVHDHVIPFTSIPPCIRWEILFFRLEMLKCRPLLSILQSDISTTLWLLHLRSVFGHKLLICLEYIEHYASSNYNDNSKRPQYNRECPDCERFLFDFSFYFFEFNFCWRSHHPYQAEGCPFSFWMEISSLSSLLCKMPLFLSFILINKMVSRYIHY